MTSADLPPSNQPPDELPTSPTEDHSHTKWELTHEAFEKLLKTFSPDHEEGPRLLLLMRLRLMRFLECRGCYSPNDLIDEVINRVARRIDEGEKIIKLNGYFIRVAGLVHEEWRRRQKSSPLDEVPELPGPAPFDEEKEARMRCLDHCLEELTIQNRRLILKYYQDERRAKIDHRKQLAESFGIPLNALRIRAHRIRGFLEKCVEDCLARAGLNRNKTGFSTL